MTMPDAFRSEVPDGSLEIRTFAAEARATADDGTPRIEGLGSVYGQRTTLGSYFQWDEEVVGGAWSSTISRDNADIRSMFNHDPNWLLGRTTAGTLRLADTAGGLAYSIDINPDDVNAMSVHAKVDRGDVSGASVWFRVISEQWTEPTEDNGLERPLRQITEAELFEVGPVVFPAFPTTTAASARSLDAVLRTAGVEKPCKRAGITAELLSNPDTIEKRITELFARNPELRDSVCDTKAAVAAAVDPDQSAQLRDADPVDDSPQPHLHVIRKRRLELLARA